MTYQEARDQAEAIIQEAKDEYSRMNIDIEISDNLFHEKMKNAFVEGYIKSKITNLLLYGTL
jgi:hypothetical protein